jgi:hypothetical protein
MMRKILLLWFLGACVLVAGGCGDGMADTRRDRQERHKRVFDNDMKQINDDWDAFWLNDRPGRLSWWQIE